MPLYSPFRLKFICNIKNKKIARKGRKLQETCNNRRLNCDLTRQIFRNHEPRRHTVLTHKIHKKSVHIYYVRNFI